MFYLTLYIPNAEIHLKKSISVIRLPSEYSIYLLEQKITNFFTKEFSGTN